MADFTRGGLGTIFAFFLGAMITAFFGVGVYTFHAPPDQYQAEIRQLEDRERALRTARPGGEPSTAERDEMAQINARRSQLSDLAEEARKPWARSTSIILILVATLTMGFSLVRADPAPVISNGLLLGGLFTMLYGVGWIVVTDTSPVRFVVITAALAITLGLGWVRFAHRGTKPRAAALADAEASRAPEDLEQRVRMLEERVEEAARALRSRRPVT